MSQASLLPKNTGGSSTKVSSHMSPDQFHRRIKKAYKEVRDFIQERGNDRLKERWPEWHDRFDWIFKQSHECPEVEIALVGGTGAGKSTLLNAIIGARVLPVSNMRACTAAISEVGYCEGAYRARVEFLPRDSWQNEVDLLLQDLRDAAREPGGERPGDPRLAISRTAIDKLWTVYRFSEDTKKDDFDPLSLVEPSEITVALDQGFAEIESGNLREFRKEIAKYLDSKHRFWPLVKTMSIRGPFKPLADGSKLVDLPGVNDPNEAREAVTKEYLKTCRFVWIVFNIKRALTADTMNLMQSDDFLRQIVMDGRADALTFVGTASDDVDIESGIDEFDLDEDAEIVEVVRARNKAVREVVDGQLGDLAAKLAELGNESSESANKLASRLRKSNTLTISAREFLRMEGLARTAASGLTEREQTEVPQLRQHMNQVCSNYGTDAHIAMLDRQLTTLFNEVRREIKMQRAVALNQKQATDQQRKELGVAVKTVRSFLKRDLQESQERLAQDLESGQALLSERIKRAVDRAQLELEDTTLRRWARTHHGTLKAVCRRGGVYSGATGPNDFPGDLCKPILNGIAFAWSEFFGEKLQQILEKWTDKLRRNADDFRQRLFDSIGGSTHLPDGIFESIKAVFDTTERLLAELLAQTVVAMEAKITEKQRTLYEKVPVQIAANMEQAFKIASEESGSGMKQRMIECLASHARDVSQVMFDDARETLLNGVRGLNDWLCKEYDKMALSVDRNASLAVENLVSSGPHATQETIELQLTMLDQFETLVDPFLMSKFA